MKRLFILLSITFLIYSCAGVDQSTPATLTILLEDSPADFQEVSIKIESVTIFNGSQWYELNNVKFPISILKYTGGESLPIVIEHIPEGEYSKIRFKFDSKENTIKVGGESHNLNISETDRQVEMPIKLNFGSNNEYLVCDMDVAASINQEGWIFKPHLEMIDLNEAGAISGILSTEDGKGIAQQMYVEILSSNGVKKSTYTNAESGQLFIRLNEGVYSISILPVASSIYGKTSIENIKVKKAEATKLGAIVLKLKEKDDK